MLSGSSLGSCIGPGAGACRTWVDARYSELIRQSGSLPRPRRTGAAGRTAALATGWPFQRPAAAGLWTQGGTRQRLELVFQRELCANATAKELARPSFSDGSSVGKTRAPRLGPHHSRPPARPTRLRAACAARHALAGPSRVSAEGAGTGEHHRHWHSCGHGDKWRGNGDTNLATIPKGRSNGRFPATKCTGPGGVPRS